MKIEVPDVEPAVAVTWYAPGPAEESVVKEQPEVALMSPDASVVHDVDDCINPDGLVVKLTIWWGVNPDPLTFTTVLEPCAP